MDTGKGGSRRKQSKQTRIRSKIKTSWQRKWTLMGRVSGNQQREAESAADSIKIIEISEKYSGCLNSCINVFVIRSLLFGEEGSSWEGDMEEKGEGGDGKWGNSSRATAVCTPRGWVSSSWLSPRRVIIMSTTAQWLVSEVVSGSRRQMFWEHRHDLSSRHPHREKSAPKKKHSSQRLKAVYKIEFWSVARMSLAKDGW